MIAMVCAELFIPDLISSHVMIIFKLLTIKWGFVAVPCLRLSHLTLLTREFKKQNEQSKPQQTKQK